MAGGHVAAERIDCECGRSRVKFGNEEVPECECIKKRCSDCVEHKNYFNES